MSRLDSRIVLGMLALVLVLPGCKKATVDTGAPPAANSNGIQVPQGAGAAVQGVLPAVGRVVKENELKQFQLLYFQQATESGPPANLEAMTGLEREMPNLYKAIKDGDLIVYWGADPNRAPAGTSSTVLAYLKDVPTKGGVVLMFDGSASNMTAQAFQNAAKPR